MDIKSELSEENRKLIENWDNQIKVKEFTLSLDNDKSIQEIKIGLQDSPFEGFISRGEVVLDMIPKVYLIVLNYIIKKLSRIIEKNLNEEGEK